MEYSIKDDAAYCLCCYLFKPEGSKGGGDSFITKGFTAWNKKERLDTHVGGCNSSHNQAFKKCEDLMKQKQSIGTAFDKQSEQIKSEYRTRLNATIDCVRWLLRQGLAFQGHHEFENSSNRGNFLELLHFYAERNENVGSVIWRNALANQQMIAPSIQKDIVCAAAKKIDAIIRNLSDDLFGILIDESCVSCKEQMAVAIRLLINREASWSELSALYMLKIHLLHLSRMQLILYCLNSD